MSSQPPRTLAEQLRGWSDQQLAGLLTARPDLATPAPQDTAHLGSRAGTKASIMRAAESLDTLELGVLDAVVALGGSVSLERLTQVVHADPDAVRTAADSLLAQALLWGDHALLRTATATQEAIGTPLSRLGLPVASSLSGYGPARVADVLRALGGDSSGDRSLDLASIGTLLSDPDRVASLVTDLDPASTRILEHLERTGSDGTIGAATEAVEPLLQRGLLAQRDRQHVSVPCEVAMSLRGGRTTRDRLDEPPSVATTPRDGALVDRTAGGAAFEAVRHLEVLLEHWSTSPPTALRGGGLAVRDLKASATLLHVTERVAALLIESAASAGLIEVGHTDELDAAWLPTDFYDQWIDLPVADRWTLIAQAWLANPRLVGLIGQKVQGKTVNALMPELERSWLAPTRQETLAELAALAPGEVLAAGTGVASLVDRLRWLRPRRPAARAEAIAWTVEEAAALGVLGLGGIAAHGRALLDGDPAAVLTPLLPTPIEQVMIQADLTAVAPGPLTQDAGRDLAVVADVESRGGATVYRFTESSVRRAFDSGWSLPEVHAFLQRISATPVPQPLSYLVEDVSRRFGVIRVGSAEAFLRSDDESALAELVADPRAANLRLRLIAPTVVISDTTLDVLLPRLRELGLAPVVEAPDGSVRVARKEPFRARTPRRRSPSGAARAVARVSAVVAAVRAGDRAAQERPAEAGTRRTPPASTLVQLRHAVDTDQTVWISYVDNDGSLMERVVEPKRVDSGWLSAYDERSQDVRSFAVHRIVAVKALD